MEKNIYNKLSIIQSDLKVPKNQYNKFGDYSYRNCEDILEALKPILKETGTVITLSDEIELLGNRYYIKATATLTDIDSKESVSNSAFAREDEARKKMDGSQLTGSASSYARKYALNGLLAIDDTQDSDFLNNSAQSLSEPQRGTQNNNNIPQNGNLEKYRNEIANTLKVKEIPFKVFTDWLQNNLNKGNLDGLSISQLEQIKKTIAEW